MQEEVNQKVISLSIQGVKITASVLKAALRKFLEMDNRRKQKATQVKMAEKTPEGGKPVSDSPKTGDNTNLWLWFMLLGIGATGTGALAFMRKKKH